MARAAASHFAYADGKAEICTAWAAAATDIDCQPGTSTRPLLDVWLATP